MSTKLKIEIKEAELFKAIITALEKFTKEARITADDTGLSCSSFDPANVAMMQFKWNKEAFATYELPEGATFFDFKPEDLKAAFKRSRAQDVCTVVVDEGFLNITLDDGVAKRRFKSSLYNLDINEKPMPNFKFSAEATVPVDRITDFSDDLSGYAESFRISIEPNTLVLEADKEPAGGLRTDLRDIDTNVTVKGEGQARYSSEYLGLLLTPAKKFNSVKLEWSKDYPLRLSYEAQNLSLTYVLAPRVENDQ